MLIVASGVTIPLEDETCCPFDIARELHDNLLEVGSVLLLAGRRTPSLSNPIMRSSSRTLNSSNHPSVLVTMLIVASGDLGFLRMTS
jgi:hypothetical protein